MSIAFLDVSLKKSEKLGKGPPGNEKLKEKKHFLNDFITTKVHKITPFPESRLLVLYIFGFTIK